MMTIAWWIDAHPIASHVIGLVLGIALACAVNAFMNYRLGRN